MMESISLLKHWLLEAKYPVAFTGAGVSTDSGLNDFRSADKGIYYKENHYGVSAEEILTPAFFKRRTKDFFDFYRTELLDLQAEPNEIHYTMADMEKNGRLKAIITQNGDNLHQRAGSCNVIDFHGNVYENTCQICRRKYQPMIVANSNDIPCCECGGIIRPGILLFGEVPEMKKVMVLLKELRKADLLLVAGTSLRVSSATRLLEHYQGRLVILNRDPTPYDTQADMVIHGELKEIFNALWPLEYLRN